MKHRARNSVALAASILMVTACAGGVGDEAGPAGQTLTVALPVNNCLAMWPFYVAQDQGFMADEGVVSDFQSLGGSAAALQAVLAGQADLALTVPQEYWSAAGEGAELTGLYGFYRQPQFSLATEADSGIETLTDLAGKTIGISEAGGGDVSYLQTLMKAGADLDVDVDYQTLVVGQGSSAVTAVERREVDAIALTFVDAILLPSLGLDLVELSSENAPLTVGSLLAAEVAWQEANPELVEGLGAALARGTEWGLEHPDDVVDICGDVSPELVEDRAFAAEIVAAVGDLVRISGDEQYGHVDEDTWNAARSTLVELALIPDGAESVGVENSYVDAWNESR